MIRGARQLVTLRGPQHPRRGSACQDIAVIPDGAMLIRDGTILTLGTTRRVENLKDARGADVLEANGAVIVPGFVDGHTHWPGNAAAGRRYLRLALRHGTTTVEVKADRNSLRELEELAAVTPRIIPTLLLPVFDEKIMRSVRRNNRALFVDPGPEGRDAEVMRRAKDLGFGLRVHAGAHADDGRLGLAVAYGARSVDHLDHSDEAQEQLLAHTALVATLVPGTGRLARRLMDRGAAVALASGFENQHRGTCSMLMVVAQACQEGGLTLEEALTAATINAAYGLGVGTECGSMEAGKRADFAILGVPDYRDILSYSGANVVARVYLEGKRVV
jgi:imidazolonepropionase